MADETAVIDAGAVVDSAPVADAAPGSDATGTTEPLATPDVDPNNPLTALQAAMDAQLGVDEPAVDPNAVVDPNAGAIPEAFQQALAISDFVKTPETVQQAVRAADEVWNVATGKVPARQMLEGFKNTNPQQYQAIVADLRDYLGADTQQANPLAELQQANPEAFAEIAKYYQQVTGKAIDGSSDPREQRLSAIEQRFAQEEQQRQQSQMQQQLHVAQTRGVEFVTSKLKGTYAEGQEAFMMPLIAAKLNGNPAALQEILQGNTKTLEAAIKSVNKELAPVIKAFNANLVKQHRALANAVPAGKGNPAQGNQKSLQPLPGESSVDHATRLWKEKLV